MPLTVCLSQLTKEQRQAETADGSESEDEDFLTHFLMVLSSWFKHNLFLEVNTVVEMFEEGLFVPATKEDMKEAFRSSLFRTKYTLEMGTASNGARIVPRTS